MEPLDDRELNQILREWRAPDLPPALQRPLRRRREPWLRWLLTGTIRIPVPVPLAVAVTALVVGWLLIPYRTAPTLPAATEPVTLADFAPLEQLTPRIVGELR